MIAQNKLTKAFPRVGTLFFCLLLHPVKQVLQILVKPVKNLYCRIYPHYRSQFFHKLQLNSFKKLSLATFFLQGNKLNFYFLINHVVFSYFQIIYLFIQLSNEHIGDSMWHITFNTPPHNRHPHTHTHMAAGTQIKHLVGSISICGPKPADKNHIFNQFQKINKMGANCEWGRE